MPNVQHLRRILAREGLSRTAIDAVSRDAPRMSDSEGWTIAAKFSGAATSSAQKKVVKAIMEEWALKNGKDWLGWIGFADSFSNWQLDTQMVLQKRMYAWQDEATAQGRGEYPDGDLWQSAADGGRVVITPSDDGMTDMAKGAVLAGKSAFQKALGDPGLMPRRSPRSFKMIHKSPWPVVNAVADGKALYNPLNGWAFNRSKPARGWSNDPAAFRDWSQLTNKERTEYLEGLFGGGFWEAGKFMPIKGVGGKGIPAKTRSKYWDVMWSPYEPRYDWWRAESVVTPKGVTLPFYLNFIWKGSKSLKQRDLQDALSDAEQTFKGVARLTDKVSGTTTLEEAVRENLRKKRDGYTTKLYFQNQTRSIDVPLTGDRDKDRDALIKSWQRTL